MFASAMRDGSPLTAALCMAASSEVGGRLGILSAAARLSRSADLFPPGSPLIVTSMSAPPVVKLPEPLQLLWLSGQPNSARATLRHPLTTTPIKNKAEFLEALAVYCDKPAGDTSNLKTLAELRIEYVSSVYSTATIPTTGINYAAAAGRAASLVYAVARTCTYSNYGDRYVAALLSLSAPPWRTAAVPCGAPAYEAIAEEYPSTANDLVRPHLERQLKHVIAGADLTMATPPDMAAAMATIATIQEITTGYPSVHVNCGVASASSALPSIAVFGDGNCGGFPWAGMFVAYSGTFIQPQVTATAVGVIVNWLIACRATADVLPGTVDDLAKFVLDGAPSALSARLRKK